MNIIKDSSEFQNTIKNGKWAGSECLVIYICENKQEFNRVGVAVGKKAGKSVVRNRLKRLIREAYRLNEGSILKGNDIIIVWRSSANVENANFHIVEKCLLKCFKKADLMKKAEEVDV